MARKRHVLVRHIPWDIDRARGLCSFIIPAFVLHGLERVAHLLHLREQHVALVREHLEARVDGVVAAQGELDVLADVPDGHASLFHAADDL